MHGTIEIKKNIQIYFFYLYEHILYQNKCKETLTVLLNAMLNFTTRKEVSIKMFKFFGL